MRRQVKRAHVKPAHIKSGPGRGEDTPVAPTRQSKGSHVYEEIKEAILSGRLQPGCPIDKSELCDRLGMSRFPVTAAISRLAYERLVVVEPQHGSFVAKIALADMLEFMMIRSAIEGDVAARAAEHRPAGLLDDLDISLKAQAGAASSGDRDAFYALDLGFHRLLLHSLDLGRTMTMLDSLRANLERIRRLLASPPGRMRATFEEHDRVRGAIAAGDPMAARDAMRCHLAQTTTMFKTFASQSPALFSDR